jgi:thiol:disulfide interchange protein
MTSNARFYIFAGLLAILLLFVALAMSGIFSFWEPAFVVREPTFK